MKHDFKLNDGVSFGYGADSYPGTVVRVTSVRVYVARDDYRCIKAPSAVGAHDGEYEFIQHKDAPIITFTFKKSGRVTPVGESRGALRHGRRYYTGGYYIDPCF